MAQTESFTGLVIKPCSVISFDTCLLLLSWQNNFDGMTNIMWINNEVSFLSSLMANHVGFNVASLPSADRPLSCASHSAGGYASVQREGLTKCHMEREKRGTTGTINVMCSGHTVRWESSNPRMSRDGLLCVTSGPGSPLSPCTPLL